MDGTRLDDPMLASIIARINAFAYRCQNDSAYTMLLLEGEVEALTGWVAAEFLGGGSQSLGAIIHPDDRPAVDGAVERALAERRNWQIDYRIRRADGALQWVQETGGGVFAPDGQLLYLEGIILDLTNRKIEEAEKLALQAHIAETCMGMMGDVEPILKVLKQLRILAVNARIEAARSGEAGAGFAVIASEISRIADETSARAARVAALTRELQSLMADG